MFVFTGSQNKMKHFGKNAYNKAFWEEWNVTSILDFKKSIKTRILKATYINASILESVYSSIKIGTRIWETIYIAIRVNTVLFNRSFKLHNTLVEMIQVLVIFHQFLSVVQ